MHQKKTARLPLPRNRERLTEVRDASELMENIINLADEYMRSDPIRELEPNQGSSRPLPGRPEKQGNDNQD